MKNILLIAFREFKMRIRNKTFLLSTFLLPIGILLFYGAIFAFSMNQFETYNIGYIDNSGFVNGNFKSEDDFIFSEINATISMVEVENRDLTAIIHIPDNRDSFLNGNFEVNTYKKMGVITKSKLEDNIQKLVESERYKQKNISKLDLEYIKKDLNISYITKDGSDESSIKENIAYAVGFGLGMMMYIILTIYGSQVMRSIMEEKTNRIVEVIISSVKPIELMVGKIFGLGMVSLLQISIWSMLFLVINIVISIFLGGNIDMDSEKLADAMSKVNQDPEMMNLIENLSSFNFIPILLTFVIYFIGGFLLYSSMFAAVGSAVNDDPQDSQALLFPIMMPIFIAFIFLTKAINNPNGTEAVISSIVPFTSPVVMMSRVVFGIGEGVSWGQLILSIVLLYGTTLLFLWLAAKIYKIGILTYGKKANWKDMISWIFVK